MKNSSGCDLTDDESIYSSSSSLASSSKLTKIVKNLINRKSHYDLTEQQPKSKRSTIHFSLFSRNNNNKQENIVPAATKSLLVVKTKKQRNSVLNLASRFLQASSTTHALPSIDMKPFVEDSTALFSTSNKHAPVELLSDTKSEQVITSMHDEELVWIRQRAQSCQTPLCVYNDTLVALHTRIMNDCICLFTEDTTSSSLSEIISDLYKMIDMLSWDTQQSKEEITKTLTEHHNKDTIFIIKQILNQCLCQYYKDVEKALVIPTKGYTIERATTTMNTQHDDMDHKDNQAHWFRTYFLDNHKACTFFGYTTEDDDTPVLISAVKEEQQLICRTKNGQDQRLYYVELGSDWKASLETATSMHFHRLVKMDQEQLVASGLQNDILRLDETFLHPRHKFGVVLIKEGQTKEEEWFANEHDASSPLFDRFLNIIGRKVALQGYTGWAAGLDTKSGDSGDYIYTNQWKDDEIAYHVSTMIPSKPGDKQQIQRKRHIGNDIVCIVFIDGNQQFHPAAIKSQFLHVFIVVRPEQPSAWRVDVVSVEDVPRFGPPLSTAVFFDEKELESYILAKLVNAEYAALKSPKFATPMKRARESILANLVEKGFKWNEESLSSSLSPLSGDDVVVLPRKSRSANMIRELSGNIVGLARRKSAQDLSEKIANYRSRKLNDIQSTSTTTNMAKKSKSEQDLLSQIVVKKGFKSRIFSGLGHHDTMITNSQ